MEKYNYLDSKKKLIKYESEMGKIKDFDKLKATFAGKTIEEQKKYFYLAFYAPGFAPIVTPLYEKEYPVIIKEDIIVGVVREEDFLLVGTGVTEDERSDNNGAGYKEYSENTFFEFTKVPLDVKVCHYLDREDEEEFFEVHKQIEEVIIDEKVKEIGSRDVKFRVKYVGSVSHWLALGGYKEKLEEVHLYLDGDKEETTRVIIPENVEDVEREAFTNCVGIKEVVLPKNLNSIQPNAFNGCSSLEKIYLPDSVCAIHYGAFNECTSLKEIRFPRGAFSIDQFAFSNCKSLKELYIPKSCEYIDYKAFSLCDKKMKIKCAVNKEFVENKWSKSWNEHSNTHDGPILYDVEWVEQ